MKPVQFSPSLMCVDFLNLSEELDLMKKHSIDYLHMDIMDGSYVPNFTLGTDFAYAMHQYSNITLDFHLMVDNVDRSFGLFAKHKGSIITIHPETSKHPVRTINGIREMGCKPGIAIDPGMSLSTVEHLLPLVDLVCIMTVNPGFAGQKLLPFCLEKIKDLVKIRDSKGYSFKIEVDGNVSWENIPTMINYGADVLVLGTSSVFNKEISREEGYTQLKELIKNKDK
ncbi:ribulose-phosphate 3-epimerase [Galbibacter mesophilus]|uniref:ribulose-phosphate 3-epimerase n=1 Tax=Galbibacter mesophilus TaxID=379069 RepID=UPI00191D1A03|nr:ribulose-phosphate 3-epimerase [Galbibacter mesophilus]MCM5663077.1 ribulose-phosphate 3-epimerase [Galbibacter mesophilus]